MEITIAEIIKLFAESSSREEFELKCSVLSLNPESLITCLIAYVKTIWDGQWQDNQEIRVVTLDEFFVMKQKLGEHVEGSWMNDLCKQMCYVVSSNCYCGLHLE